MLKKRVFAVVFLALTALHMCAAAQTLPGIDCFSPGLVKLSALEGAGAPIQAEAEVTLDKAMYARDLSVLSAMLDGTTLVYAGADDEEALTIRRNGETLGVYALPEGEAMDALNLLGEELGGVAILERVPLETLAAWLEGLGTGDALAMGFAVSEPFALERTMSDDGARLTKISITAGSIAREGEAPYAVSGFLRQPAGRAPKDTFELTLTQDEKNFFELSYSAQRENEITKKDKAGTTSVRTMLKAAGKLAGSSISSRLSVTMRNAWTADGENLDEKVSITATLTHQDNRPGLRMKRLNAIEGELRNVIRLTTTEAGSDVIDLTDEITMELVMDSNTVLAGGADVRMRIGGEAPQIADAAPAQQADIERLAGEIYQQLDEDARALISEGL